MVMRVLVIDTCGEVGSLALGEGGPIAGSETVPARGASSALLPAVRRLLQAKGWVLGDLDGIGVVSGPGSFTGVRVGLAAAKGLCEAAGLRLVGVSRLAVLAESAELTEGCAVLDAGRGELYVRFIDSDEEPREVLCESASLRGRGRVVVAEEKVKLALAERRPELFEIGVEQALAPVLRRLREGEVNAGVVDANYVRSEGQIYGKTGTRP